MRKQTKLVAVLSAASLLAIGASMTSFAKGWTEEDGEWVYLDSDGDRVTEEWKKSGSNYYWLDEDGIMATDQIVEDDDDVYYVDATGVRVTNQWVSVPNEDDDEVDGKEVDTLWYYLGSSGAAYRAKGTDEFKNSIINGKRYLFDEDGHMVSGWTYVDNDTYYLGEENEGWAHTGWQYLEIDEDEMTCPSDDDYDNEEAWFHFKSSGKARKNSRTYIGGAYYTFDENGVMLDDWVSGTPGSATPGRSFYAYDNGNQASGWVYTYENSDQDGDEEWFYMVSSNKNTAYNAGGAAANGSGSATKYKEGDVVDKAYNSDVLAAKVIKGKTYLFDNTGVMLTGVFEFDAPVKRQGGSGDLDAGIYYFNKSGGSVEGQMETGKTTITYDGEDYVYYFQGTGKAYTLVLKDSCLYDRLGVRVEAEDGNSNSVIDLATLLEDDETVEIKGVDYVDGSVVVSSTGKVKKSGTVTIDGVKYEVDNYFVTKAYDKDDDNKTDLTDLYVAATPAADAE